MTQRVSCMRLGLMYRASIGLRGLGVILAGMMLSGCFATPMVTYRASQGHKPWPLKLTIFIVKDSLSIGISNQHEHVHDIGKSYLRSMEELSRLQFSDVRVKTIPRLEDVPFPQKKTDIVVVIELTEAALQFKNIRTYDAQLGHEYDAPTPDNVRLTVRVTYMSPAGSLIHKHELTGTARCDAAAIASAREVLARNPGRTLWQVVGYQGDVRVEVERKLLAALAQALDPLTRLPTNPDFIRYARELQFKSNVAGAP